MSGLGLAAILLVAGVGAFVQGSVGFGYNLVAAPVLGKSLL